MKYRISTASLLLVALMVAPSFAQPADKKGKAAPKEPMPVYVTPFYNSKGPKIAVGPYSDELAAADAETIGNVIAKLKKDQSKLRAEVMYVAAIRLYDLGLKDEAVYWFYAAQYRGRLFMVLLDPAEVGGIGSEAFELKHAYNAFNELAGTYINGYAQGDLKTLEKTLQQVLDESKRRPKMLQAYPKVKFIPENAWLAKNTQVADGLAKLLDYVKNNADEIRAQRKASGIEGKY